MGPFDILAEQHRELEERISALEAEEDPGEAEAQRERFQALADALRVHARLEERYLYPLVARIEGRVRAREEAEDHLALRELVEELEELTPGGDEWWARFTALEDLLVAHVQEEEAEVFPRNHLRAGSGGANRTESLPSRCCERNSSPVRAPCRAASDCSKSLGGTAQH